MNPWSFYVPFMSVKQSILFLFLTFLLLSYLLQIKDQEGSL